MVSLISSMEGNLKWRGKPLFNKCSTKGSPTSGIRTANRVGLKNDMGSARGQRISSPETHVGFDGIEIGPAVLHQRMADAAVVSLARQRVRPLPRRFPVGCADFLRLHFNLLVRLQVMKARGMDAAANPVRADARCAAGEFQTSDAGTGSMPRTSCRCHPRNRTEQ